MPAVPQPNFTWQGRPGPTQRFKDKLEASAVAPPDLVEALPDLVEALPDEGPAGAPDLAEGDLPAADGPDAIAPPPPFPVPGGPVEGLEPEKIIGADNLRPIAFLEEGIEIAKAVARITIDGIDYGTGFLIAPDLLLTNSHVIADRDQARKARVQFNYQDRFDGGERRSEIIATDADREDGFHASPYLKNVVDPDHLDYAVIRLAKAVGNKYSVVPLSSARTIPAAVADAGYQPFDVFIIQHPDGGKKKIAVADNELVWADHLRCQYLTDTQGGSSGAPVFDSGWRLIALHHAGGYTKQPGDPQGHIQNEGILISAIVADLPGWAKP